jgi:hypothetical protein
VTAPHPIEVTVRDPETGDSETATITDDYVITTAGSCYVAHTAAHADGTHVITVRGRKPGR